MDEDRSSQINTSLLLATRQGRGEINSRDTGRVGMRKSAVSVSSGSGMPAHRAAEGISGGGEKMEGKERKGQCDKCHFMLLSKFEI